MVFKPLAAESVAAGKLFGHEGHYAGVLLDQRVDAGRGVLIVRAELLFAEILLHVFEAEHHYRLRLAAYLLPVGDVLIEHFLDLLCVKLLNGVALVHN